MAKCRCCSSCITRIEVFLTYYTAHYPYGGAQETNMGGTYRVYYSNGYVYSSSWSLGLVGGLEGLDAFFISQKIDENSNISFQFRLHEFSRWFPGYHCGGDIFYPTKFSIDIEIQTQELRNLMCCSGPYGSVHWLYYTTQTDACRLNLATAGAMVSLSCA